MHKVNTSDLENFPMADPLGSRLHKLSSEEALQKICDFENAMIISQSSKQVPSTTTHEAQSAQSATPIQNGSEKELPSSGYSVIGEAKMQLLSAGKPRNDQRLQARIQIQDSEPHQMTSS